MEKSPWEKTYVLVHHSKAAAAPECDNYHKPQSLPSCRVATSCSLRQSLNRLFAQADTDSLSNQRTAEHVMDEAEETAPAHFQVVNRNSNPNRHPAPACVCLRILLLIIRTPLHERLACRHARLAPAACIQWALPPVKTSCQPPPPVARRCQRCHCSTPSFPTPALPPPPVRRQLLKQP